jgi:hypothetical protein
MSQKRLITRTGKGQKLTVQEMDGNLEFLQDTGLGVNRGVMEPTDVDLSDIKNQFINKGDVSVSLGDTEITHEITGFVREGELNFIQIADESSDIQEGDTITVAGDDSLFSQITTSIQQITVKIDLNGNAHSTIITNLLSEPNVENITVTGSDELVWTDVQLAYTGHELVQQGIEVDGNIFNKWSIELFVDSKRSNFRTNNFYLNGLSILLKGTGNNEYDGVYEIVGISSNGNPLIEIIVPQSVNSFPSLDVTGINFDITIPSNNGTYTYVPIDLGGDPFNGALKVDGILRQLEVVLSLDGEIYTNNTLGDVSYEVEVGSNNGTYTAIGWTGDYIQVEEPVVSKEVTGVTGNWIKSTRVQFSWIHAVLECGVVIWEAYDNDSNDNINGYWLAMKQNGEGEWVMVDFVKMTESFWNNWYVYTVKDPSNPISVKLVGYDSENGGGNTWGGLQSYSPKFYHCELSMNESLTELTVTESFVLASESTYWDAIATELGVSAESIGNGAIATPWFDSNDDWYGMMWGERMGWIWIPIADLNGDSLGIVGFNMLTGETQKYTPSQFNPFGGSYSTSQLFSHPKFGLLLELYSPSTEIRYFYSPNFIEQKLIKLNQPTTYNNINSVTNGTWDFSGDFAYRSEHNIDNRGVIYNLMRIGIESGTVEYGIVVDKDSTDNGGWQNSWAKHNGWISSLTQNSYKARNYVVWRDDESKPKLVKIYSYPTNFTPNTSFSADYVWNLPAIISSTSTYKNNTF